MALHLYIMGSGHSGSTILDILLGNSGELESVGELLAGLSRADSEPCSCGATMPGCAFWGAVRARLEAEGIAWSEVCGIVDTGFAGLWRVWRAGRGDPAMARRARVAQALGRAIAASAGKPHVVNSSKTPAHGLLLLRHLPEARMIHVVRDPRQILRSFVWRVRSGKHLNAARHGLAARSGPLFLMRMALGWTVANLACDLMARAYPGQVVRVRFEDLCARPGHELGRIADAFGLDLAGVAQMADDRAPLAVGHNVGGNHLRHAGEVRFDPGGGRRPLSLPTWLAAAATILCGPLMWRHGYPLRDHPPRPAGTANVLSG